MVDPTRRVLRDFQDLMRFRVMDVLLVSTPYDTFVLEEAGELSERMVGEFRNLDLHYAPALTGVATGAEALDLLGRQPHVNLIITTPHVGDMDAAELARRVRAAGHDIPVVLLAWDTRELSEFAARADVSQIERAFLWQGDARILVAICKQVEDRRNAEHDTATVGVQVILLVEDSVRYYSSFLPVMYGELLHHSQRVIAEGLNLSQKILRMRARPKILLCTSFEEAAQAFDAYRDDVLGIISDVEFPRAAGHPATAGADLARMVRRTHPDIPIILHSARPENADQVNDLGAHFLPKGSPLLLRELRRVMLHDFAFGDFVFRLPAGAEVGRASDLRELEEELQRVPEASISFHAARNHFSRWLKARTEFALAHALRPRRPSDYRDVEALRQDLVSSISQYREDRSRTLVADFDRESFDLSSDFCRIGGGSLGGKARGLAFVRRLLWERGLRRRWPGVVVGVPTAAVIGTDVFEQFVDENGLRDFAIECEDDAELLRRFLAARFPEQAALDVGAYLERLTVPLAVRSSSLLEDSQHQPFTGVYDTLMLANSGEHSERTARALRAVQRVYASTFFQRAKAYLRATPYRLEEERMAVILQRVVGAAREDRFYPDFAGVARSHNFYPTEPMRAGDGIAAVALGLGRGVVDGGPCLRFCPRWPRHVSQLAAVEELLDTTQREFWALPLTAAEGDGRERSFGLEVAERDGTLAAVGSTYSADNEAVHDGLARSGARVVTFGPVLKQGAFPLAEVLVEMLEQGQHGMGTPVEIEFAVDLGRRGREAEFGFLQMRPLTLSRESEALELGSVDPGLVVCRSPRVLGHGRLEGLCDLVVVDFRRFERSRSREAAAEVGRLNARLVGERAPYVLVGVGRWGSRDPWLGIPVTWDQVNGAAVIVEAGLRDIRVEPSQGSHFFQNLTSFNVGYFTVNSDLGEGQIDWDWLDSHPVCSAAFHVRHLHLEQPLTVLMDGRHHHGVILRPGA